MSDPGSRTATVGGLFPPGVSVAVACIDAIPAYRHAAEEAAVARAVGSRQRQFATGRRLAHELLDELGAPDTPLTIAPDRAPAWPAGLVGSIAHTEELCAVVVARATAFRSLGLDHEAPTPLDRDLWPTILRPIEARWLADQDATEQGWLAKLVFSAKESAYKAWAPHVRTILEFEDVELSIDTVRHTVSARLCRGDLAAPTRVLTGRWARDERSLFTGLAIPVDPA